jgi:hypothetical protein
MYRYVHINIYSCVYIHMYIYVHLYMYIHKYKYLHEHILIYNQALDERLWSVVSDWRGRAIQQQLQVHL